jgi:hypothetical protein
MAWPLIAGMALAGIGAIANTIVQHKHNQASEKLAREQLDRDDKLHKEENTTLYGTPIEKKIKDSLARLSAGKNDRRRSQVLAEAFKRMQAQLKNQDSQNLLAQSSNLKRQTDALDEKRNQKYLYKNLSPAEHTESPEKKRIQMIDRILADQLRQYAIRR